MYFTIFFRGTSSPGPPDTLARGDPDAPLRSRGSLASLVRSRKSWLLVGTLSALAVERGQRLRAGIAEQTLNLQQVIRLSSREHLERFGKRPQTEIARGAVRVGAIEPIQKRRDL